MDSINETHGKVNTEEVQMTLEGPPKNNEITSEEQRIIGIDSGPNADPEPVRNGSFKKKSVLLRRSTTILKDRQPTEGLAGMICFFCCSLLFFVVLLAMINGLSVACIVIGIIYLDKENCPGDPSLAPMLITSGFLAVIFSLIEGRSRLLVAKEEGDDGEVKVTIQKKKKTWFDHVVYIARMVKMVVFIYLVFIVFRLSPNVKYEPYTIGPDEVNFYCNPTLFLFAYWMIMVFVIISCIILAIFGCVCCVVFGMAVHQGNITVCGRGGGGGD